MTQLTHNGTEDVNGTRRTYGGDPNLVHIMDHHRQDVARVVADTLGSLMRLAAKINGTVYDPDHPLCPGCYMIALFDAAVHLANDNGQDVRELGHTLSKAFADLAERGEYTLTEEMLIVP